MSLTFNSIKKSIYDFFPKTISIWSFFFYFFFFYFITYTIATIVLYSKQDYTDLVSNETGDYVDSL